MEVSQTELEFGKVVCGQCGVITLRIRNPQPVRSAHCYISSVLAWEKGGPKACPDGARASSRKYDYSENYFKPKNYILVGALVFHSNQA